MPIAILIGLGAGITSAMLFASASTGTAFGLFVLFLLSPLPVVMAGLGWGWASAAIAAADGAMFIAILGTGRAALFYTLALGLPAVLFTYLALLNRPVQVASSTGAPTQVFEWYPIGRLVTWAAIWASALTALALFAIGPDVATLRTALGEAFEKMLVIRGVGGSDAASGGLSEADKKAFVDIMVISFPWAIATSWLVMAILNIWAAGHVVRLSGRLARPWPDLPSIVLPRTMPIVLAVAIALSFLPDVAGLVASGAASAIMFAYLLVGLAVLHAVTLGMPARPMLLSLVYGTLVLMSPFSSLFVAVLGLAEPLIPIRRRPPSNPSPPGALPPTT